MGSFLKRGLRQNTIDKRKQGDTHIKGFYKTLGKVIEVSNKLSELNITIDESNVDSESYKLLGRNLDSMERLMILGRLMKDESEDNSK